MNFTNSQFSLRAPRIFVVKKRAVFVFAPRPLTVYLAPCTVLSFSCPIFQCTFLTNKKTDLLIRFGGIRQPINSNKVNPHFCKYPLFFLEFFVKVSNFSETRIIAFAIYLSNTVLVNTVYIY